jgi:cell division protein FtsB
MAHREEVARGKEKSSAKTRELVITVAICLLLVVSIITFVSKLVEYNELQAKKSELEEKVNSYKDSIEELEYWLEAPMDDDYIMKFAREKLDLFRADEIVFNNGE